MTKTTNMTASEHHHRKTKLRMLAFFGIIISAITCIACMVAVDGEACRTAQLATCPGCTNYYSLIVRSTCEDHSPGSKNCTQTEVACMRIEQVSHCFLAGTGEHPEYGTNYCFSPGVPVEYQVDTTLKAVVSGGSCPSGG